MLAASTAWPLLDREFAPRGSSRGSCGLWYGPEPEAGLSSRRAVALDPGPGPAAPRGYPLGILILPADERSPAASAVGVVDFIDEWVTRPTRCISRIAPSCRKGPRGWTPRRAVGRGGGSRILEVADQLAICDRLCDRSRAAPELDAAARFFARYRDLTAGGFYSSPPVARTWTISDVPLARFEGPPATLLKALGLS